MTPEEANARAASLLGLLEAARSADYIGEGVSQLEHALQAAALARAAGAPGHEVVAALLHDIGHLCAGPHAPSMNGCGVVRHEEIGADHLAALGLAARVVELVRGHVATKRYLVGADARYAARLSVSSRETLRHQGGPMDERERRTFEAHPQLRALLRLRAWDDAAKVPDLPVDGVAAYAELLRAELFSAETTRSLPLGAE